MNKCTKCKWNIQPNQKAQTGRMDTKTRFNQTERFKQGLRKRMKKLYTVPKIPKANVKCNVKES